MSEPEEIFVLNKRVRLLQPPKGFRTSLDSVMLAAACPAKEGDHVLDMGAGVGGASFCLFKRTGCHVTGVEREPEYADLAQQNIALNNAQGLAAFIQSDIRDYKADAPFDHIMCNPPYFEAGAHTPSPDNIRAQALGHHEDEQMTVKDWIDAGFRNLRSGGSLTMIHQASMTDDIIQALGRRFGAVEIIPLWPRRGEAAKRVVIRARKDRQTPCTLHPGLVLHNEGGYTPETDGILRDMQPLT